MAKITGEDDPMRGLIAGTLTYVAPEQVRGEDITPAVDVYALGVLAYQLLLGLPPFAAKNDLELLDKHLRDEPPRPRTLAADLPAALDALMVAMLAKQPADRPSLSDVSRSLRDAMTARPVAPQAAATAADALGRPSLTWLAGRPLRLASAAIGVALTLASVALTVAG
jgi:serine/threonine-protein kinase